MNTTKIVLKKYFIFKLYSFKSELNNDNIDIT